jgi:hypothetical protein
MRSVSIASLLVIVATFLVSSNAFVPAAQVSTAFTRKLSPVVVQGFMGDKEREGLTREDEPEDFFAT